MNGCLIHLKVNTTVHCRLYSRVLPAAEEGGCCRRSGKMRRGLCEVLSIEDVTGRDDWSESAGQWSHVVGKGGPGGEQQVPGEASTGWRVDGPEGRRDKAKMWPDRITVPDGGGGLGGRQGLRTRHKLISKQGGHGSSARKGC